MSSLTFGIRREWESCCMLSLRRSYSGPLLQAFFTDWAYIGSFEFLFSFSQNLLLLLLFY